MEDLALSLPNKYQKRHPSALIFVLWELMKVMCHLQIFTPANYSQHVSEWSRPERVHRFPAQLESHITVTSTSTPVPIRAKGDRAVVSSESQGTAALMLESGHRTRSGEKKLLPKNGDGGWLYTHARGSETLGGPDKWFAFYFPTSISSQTIGWHALSLCLNRKPSE